MYGPMYYLKRCFISPNSSDKLSYASNASYEAAIRCSFFIHDNVRPHAARPVENITETETIRNMECPACLFEFNPSSHVWKKSNHPLQADSLHFS